MFRKIPKHILFWFSALVMGLLFGSALQIALAWTVPSATPPGSNVAPPLNTSAADQTKTGSLIINGDGKFIRASHFSDQNNTGYYLDPNGSSVLNNVTAGGAINATGIVQSGTSIRAPYFSDHNNTAYYLDPNSTSRLSHATIDNLNSYGYVNANVNMIAGAYMQSPIFYDNNDPMNFSLDPNGTSKLHHVSMTGQLGLGLGGGLPQANRQIDSQGYIKSRTGFCIGSACIDTWPSGGGGYSYTHYCYNTNFGTPVCVNAGGTQGYCPAGYKQEKALGAWGSCYIYCPSEGRTVHTAFTALGYCGGGTGDYDLLPGGTCGVDHHTRVVGSAYICSSGSGGGGGGGSMGSCMTKTTVGHQATCPAGYVATGGGVNPGATSMHTVAESFPTKAGVRCNDGQTCDGWYGCAHDGVTGSCARDVLVFAMCCQTSAPPPTSSFPCTCRTYVHNGSPGIATYINCGAGETLITSYFAAAGTAARGPVYFPCSPTAP